MRTGRLQAGVTLVLAVAAVARAATITVNSTADAVDNDSNCTLREAILAANSDTAVDGCAAGSGPDVVIVPAGTYGLGGKLDVTDDLELVGAGGTLTGAGTRITPPIRTSPPPCGPLGCSFAQTDRVFDIDPAGAGISVRLSGIRLGPFVLEGTTVDEGGAIRNRGTLAVVDSIVLGGALVRGGGIFSLGPLRVERSYVSGRASSGITGLGPLEVIDSTIRGGIISAGGPLTLTSSTVTGGGNGVIAAGAATLVNSTISGNTGGGIVADGLVELSNVTVTDNHGGGVTAGSMVLRNTIVAGNTPADCVVGSTSGNAYNIDGDGSCGLSGTDRSRVGDPRLGPVADNGGPTFTHALLTGSPAIDAGSPAPPGSGRTACEGTDQRGVARPFGSGCDVGAFEDTSTRTASCPLLPRTGCQAELGERSKLTQSSQRHPDGSFGNLSWSWVGSAAVPVGDFADPVSGATSYTLCVYGGDGSVPSAFAAPAGGTCGKRPCWRATSSGFTYANQLLYPDGVRKVVLAGGEVAGKAKITLKASALFHGGLPLPAIPPVRVQLLRSDAATCWDATFSQLARNDGKSLNARSDP
jgi:CSLREA domain-containing protein